MARLASIDPLGFHNLKLGNDSIRLKYDDSKADKGWGSLLGAHSFWTRSKRELIWDATTTLEYDEADGERSYSESNEVDVWRNSRRVSKYGSNTVEVTCLYGASQRRFVGANGKCTWPRLYKNCNLS